MAAAGAPGPRPHPAPRITVALIPKAQADLAALRRGTGLSVTDLVNRAISLYEFFEAQMAAGSDLLVRDRKTRDMQVVRLL